MNDHLSDAWLQRFGGTARLYGRDALAVFAAAHVCVIGIGGVGSWAAEALSRTGIGAITLIDMDDVCVTNTNRQIHALRDRVGQPKIAVMAERIAAINPECRVTAIDDFVTADNVAQRLNGDFDYVIDAIATACGPKRRCWRTAGAIKYRWSAPAAPAARPIPPAFRWRIWRKPSKIRWRPKSAIA